MSAYSLSRLWSSVIIAASAVALVWAVWSPTSRAQSTMLIDIDHWTFDFIITYDLGLSRPVNHVVVINFDDASFSQDSHFPVARGRIASLIGRVLEGNPKVIGLDLFLSEPRKEDALLKERLKGTQKVILASQEKAGGLPAIRPSVEFCKPEDAAVKGYCREDDPAFGYAAIDLPLDSDGFVRRMNLFLPGTPPLLSFPAMLAQLYADTSLVEEGKKLAVTLGGHRFPYVDTSAKTSWIGSWSSRAAPLSAISVLNPKFDPTQAFGGKVVIIGQSGGPAPDRYLTPVFRTRPASGVRVMLSGAEIHAAAVETLLSGCGIQITAPEVLWPVTGVIATLFLLAFRTVRVRFGFFVFAAFLLAICGAAQVLCAAGHHWFPVIPAVLSIAFSVPVALTYDFVQERFLKSAAMHEREQVMGMFSRYVSPEVATEIWNRRDEMQLAGEQRTATILFTDIRSFTAITAGQPSQAVLRWLNEYLTAMDEIVTAHHGFLNKFMGDGIMVLFGVPLSEGEKKDALHSVRCAVAMVQTVAEMNSRHVNEPNYPPLRIGAGIHTGTLTSGNIGSLKRMEYSVIGEAVNLASRLESLTKEFHTDIVLSAATYELVQSEMSGFRDLGLAAVRGFHEAFKVYTLEVPRDPVQPVPGIKENVHEITT